MPRYVLGILTIATHFERTEEEEEKICVAAAQSHSQSDSTLDRICDVKQKHHIVRTRACTTLVSRASFQSNIIERAVSICAFATK